MFLVSFTYSVCVSSIVLDEIVVVIFFNYSYIELTVWTGRWLLATFKHL